MRISVEGEEGTGKTTFAYTAPLPIVGFCFDLGSERAIYGTQYDKWFAGKKIKVVEYDSDVKPTPYWSDYDITIYELPQPIQLDTTKILGCIELWEYFTRLLVGAIEDKSVSSIVVDTMTLARKIKADAYLQELQQGSKQPRKQLLQIEWSHPNGAIGDIFSLVAGRKKNFVPIHHLTDERKDGIDKDGSVVSMITGNRVTEGWSKTNRNVDVVLRMDNSSGKIGGRLGKVGYNPDLQGMALDNPSWNSVSKLIMSSIDDRIKIGLRE